MTKIIHGLLMCLAFFAASPSHAQEYPNKGNHDRRALCGRRTDGYRGAIDRRADDQDLKHR